MSFKDRIEQNPVIWFIGTFASGFLAGIAAYGGIQQIAHLTPVTEQKLEALEMALGQARDHTSQCETALQQARLGVQPTKRLQDETEAATKEAAGLREQLAEADKHLRAMELRAETAEDIAECAHSENPAGCRSRALSRAIQKVP